MRASRDRNRLEPRVGADCAQQVADVIAHRIHAHLQLVGDLACRAAALEELEDLRLARRQIQLRVCMWFFDEI